MTIQLSRLFVLCIFCVIQRVFGKVDDYAVVIDAGSTGSRCFVFHVMIDYDDNRDVTSASCGKVIPGLSTFIDNPDDASAYLAPLLQNAAKMIPQVHHLSTHIYIKATAGMRLLSKDVQHKLWEALVRGANRSPDIPFIISEEHIGTIDGHQEAFYAVLASNYIAGSIDGNLA
jgi:Golgi nucleoside diphosphatase